MFTETMIESLMKSSNSAVKEQDRLRGLLPQAFDMGNPDIAAVTLMEVFTSLRNRLEINNAFLAGRVPKLIAGPATGDRVDPVIMDETMTEDEIAEKITKKNADGRPFIKSGQFYEWRHNLYEVE
jgi:hypothetical protein